MGNDNYTSPPLTHTNLQQDRFSRRLVCDLHTNLGPKPIWIWVWDQGYPIGPRHGSYGIAYYATNGQQCNRNKTCIGIGLYHLNFEPDTSISISLVGEKIHCLGFGFKCLCFFSSIRPNILCIKDIFSGRLEQSSEIIQNTCLTLQRQYLCIVSKKWDNTNPSFVGIQILRQYKWTPDTILSHLCCTVETG
jgi:hypothetical protein